MRMKKISALAAVPFLAFSLAACGGSDSVSKQQFTDGFAKAASEVRGTTISGSDAERIKKLGGCIYDKVNGKVSGGTLKAVANGDTEKKITGKDRDVLRDASQECIKEVQGSQMSN